MKVGPKGLLGISSWDQVKHGDLSMSRDINSFREQNHIRIRVMVPERW